MVSVVDGTAPTVVVVSDDGVVVVSDDGIVVVSDEDGVVVGVAPKPTVVPVAAPELPSVVEVTDGVDDAAAELSVTLWITVWRTTVGSP